MALQVAASTLVTVRWSSVLGRHYVHNEKLVACLSCPRTESGGMPEYTTECKAADHQRHREVETTVQEDAPEESRQVPKVYAKATAAMRKLGIPCGPGDFLIPKARRAELEPLIASLEAELDAAQKTWKHCKASLTFRILEIDPSLSPEANLKSIRQDIEGVLTKITEAITSGDTAKIRKALRETKDLAMCVEGQTKTEVESLAKYADQVAKRLVEAAELGQQHVELVVSDAKQGAERFANILADLTAPAADAA